MVCVYTITLSLPNPTVSFRDFFKKNKGENNYTKPVEVRLLSPLNLVLNIIRLLNFVTHFTAVAPFDFTTLKLSTYLVLIYRLIVFITAANGIHNLEVVCGFYKFFAVVAAFQYFGNIFFSYAQ